jgi:Hint domain
MSVIDSTTGTLYPTLSAAISGSNANDVIRISAGSYVENFPDITHSLTIQAVGGLAFLTTPQPEPVNGRAILNVPGNQNVSLTIFGLALSGAVDADNNGAGILFETGNAHLDISNSWFFNNQDGILSGHTNAFSVGGMTVTIDHSEFNNNGVPPSNPRYGFDHNVYVNAVDQFTLTNSYIHDALGGHEVKSRALHSTILNNRIQDGPTVTASYSIDLPSGGVDVVSGNVLEKGPNAENKYFIHFEGESSSPINSLLISGNTFIDDRIGGGNGLFNQSKDANGKNIPATFTANTFYGMTAAVVSHDAFGPPPDVVEPDNVFAGGPGPALDTSHPFNGIEAACYARGTMLHTPGEAMLVERLRPGRLVTTLTQDGPVARTVKWLGHRRIDLTTHPRPETVAPIRIERDAFADNMPHTDLLLSPDHAVFVDGMLICVRQLVNGSTIRIERGLPAVDYYHVELDQHAILVAEGLPAESYLDTGNRGFFANSGAPLTLHPDMTDEAGRPVRETDSCAPFVWDEANVLPIWQRLVDRATAIGRPVLPRVTTTDADLRLLADQRTTKPVISDSDRVIFVLPRGASEVRLVSRAQAPTEARPWLGDQRRLGVRVKRFVLRGADETREIPVDHPDLTRGWWAVERDGQIMSRWTDGEAVLPLPEMRGPVMLELHLAGSMIYAVDTAAEDRTERRAAA